MGESAPRRRRARRATLGLAAAAVAAVAVLVLTGQPNVGHPSGAHSFDALIAEYAGDAQQITQRLAATLALRQREKVPTVYHHIHKSGGTSTCHALIESNATLMSCKDHTRATPPELARKCNCNAPLPLLENPLIVGSRQEVEAFLRQHRWLDVLAEEAGMTDDPYFGPAAVQVVVVRNPLARCVSHMLHYRIARGFAVHGAPVTPEFVAAAVDNATATLAGSPTFESFRQRHHVDNFITRFFAGASCRNPRGVNATNYDPALHPPLPPITEAVFRRALANMAKMDAVLVLEEAGTPEAGELLRALGLQPFAPKTRAGSSFSNGSTDYGATLLPAVRHRLTEWQSWDLLLYYFAQLRHHQLLAAWAQLKHGHPEPGG